MTPWRWIGAACAVGALGIVAALRVRPGGHIEGVAVAASAQRAERLQAEPDHALRADADRVLVEALDDDAERTAVASEFAPGRLHGRVTRAEDGSPVVGARVSVVTRGSSDTSDSDGRYSIEFIERATVYLVQVDATETSALERKVVKLTVEPGHAVRLDLLLGLPPKGPKGPPTFALTGRVVDATTGEPLPYFRVMPGRMDGGGSVRHRFDGEDGWFRCEDLAVGTYVVFVEGSGYVRWDSGERDWFGGEQHLDVRLFPKRTLDLSIEWGDGSQPRSGVVVGVRELSGDPIRATSFKLEGGLRRLNDLPADVVVLVLSGLEIEGEFEVEVDLRSPLEEPLRVVLPGGPRVRLNLIFYSIDPTSAAGVELGSVSAEQLGRWSDAGALHWLEVAVELEFYDAPGSVLTRARFASDGVGWQLESSSGSGVSQDFPEPAPLLLGWGPHSTTHLVLKAAGHHPLQVSLEGGGETQNVVLVRE